MTGRTLRVLGIGAGYFSQFHYDSWKRLGRAELAGICDLDRRRAEAIGGAPVFTDVAEALASSDADLVDVITPPAARLAVAEQVAAAGLPMIVQKPLADDLAGARAVAALAKRYGITMLVHENFRFQPWYREARRLLDRGLLGDPVSIVFRMRPGDGRGPDAYMARQPYFQQMTRFLIHETAIHFIDTLRYLMGEVGEVFADLRRLNPVIAGEDAGIVLFRFRGGGRGTYDGNRLGEFEAANPRLTMGEMWLEGSDARLRLAGDGSLWLKPNGQPEREHVYRWSDHGFGGDCVHAFQSHAIAHFLDGAAAETDVFAYLRNVEIEEAVYRAAGEGRWIAV
ncbi:MAG: Gfo/Idh/MocA family protein [Minwuia sp.]|uniref:Gfo/Idh/MocA family protein n=1 Tax=Minwuia sp. TaxID=2493630 RepID=UPI003A84E802